MIKSMFNPVLHFCAILLAYLSTKCAIGPLVAIPLLFIVSKLEKTNLA